MRHRAGLGISEQADVISVIVSEETGAISIADNGVLVRGLSVQQLRNELKNRLAAPSDKSARSIWNVLKAGA
jgi:diadenylate cyclase